MFIELNPIFKQNYKCGYVFFTARPGGFIHEGISYFIDDDSNDNVEWSHCGIVVGENAGVEATFDEGVHYVNLDKYFSSNDTRIVFKEPRALEDTGSIFAKRYAKKKVGEKLKYDFKLILGMMIVNSFVGKKCFSENFKKKIMRFFNSKNRYICSELVMEILYRGSLCDDADAFKDPMELFNHPCLKEWKTSCMQDKKS